MGDPSPGRTPAHLMCTHPLLHRSYAFGNGAIGPAVVCSGTRAVGQGLGPGHNHSSMAHATTFSLPPSVFSRNRLLEGVDAELEERDPWPSRGCPQDPVGGAGDVGQEAHRDLQVSPWSSLCHPKAPWGGGGVVSGAGPKPRPSSPEPRPPPSADRRYSYVSLVLCGIVVGPIGLTQSAEAPAVQCRAWQRLPAARHNASAHTPPPLCERQWPRSRTHGQRVPQAWDKWGGGWPPPLQQMSATDQHRGALANGPVPSRLTGPWNGGVCATFRVLGRQLCTLCVRRR